MNIFIQTYASKMQYVNLHYYYIFSIEEWHKMYSQKHIKRDTMVSFKYEMDHRLKDSIFVLRSILKSVYVIIF